eukprot:CAMPEP_0118957844 /NCGR_PEP_ID=MMETSP1169-20130426/62317_1 /TAXON_ID=36882 /ORGANISM="Pyramimonas obovata, Strain CCMP722" /LENGTH=1091 /DNA_ID=CAMNT_0006905945 /DNA_START=129 /DNA_END=3404 /DNA_ORIENTATION=-
MSIWNYCVTAHKPTSVTHSCVGHFTSETEVNLIIAKYTRIEIHKLTAEGLEPMLDVPIYGRIATMKLFRPPGETKDWLFLSTERYKFCVLTYNEHTGELETRAHGGVQEKVGRPTDHGHIGIISHDCSMIGLHLYDGHFKVIPIDEKGQLKEAFNIRLEELQVIDMVFLYGTTRPTLALLYQDQKDQRHMRTYEVLLKDKDFAEGPRSQSNLDAGASIIIAVPMPLGGMIIVGERTIVYLNGHVMKTIPMNYSVTKAYGRVDADGSRYLLSDHSGMLHLLALTHDKERVLGLKLEALGETSSASTISYLDNGVVYIGSSTGDSQVVRLNTVEDPRTGSYVEVLDTHTNLGPITDLCVVDLERQGQGQVVTCSGVQKDGSLRIVRNGIGINEQASVELPGIKGMWSLRESSAAAHDTFLVVTFVSETRVLGINMEDELEETELDGFEGEQQTLYCGNAAHDQLVQVTCGSLRLVSASTRQLVASWAPPSGFQINIAAANNTQVLLATGGGNLVYLEIGPGSLTEVKAVQLAQEISCLDINPIGPQPDRATLAVAGLWSTEAVVFSLPELTELTREALGGEVIPRSVLFCAFEAVPYLLVAMGDGHLVNFVVDAESGKVWDRKKISLGTQPISLRTFRSKQTTHVFAASDRLTVIYSSNKKLLYSNVNLRDVSHMSPFNSASFPDSLAISVENNLTIGTIDEIQKLHIRTVMLGEQPRRIAHQEASRTFGLITLCDMEGWSEEPPCNALRLLDSQTFETLHRYQLDATEVPCSVLSCTFADDPVEYYVVGTAFMKPDEVEPNQGRIMVFSVEDQKVVLVAEKETKGAVYNLNAFGGKLLAGINSRIQLYRWAAREGSHELLPECSHHGNILALYVVTRGDFIVVGDLMKSISLLMYKPEEGVIEDRARDFNANWMTAVEVLDDDTYLGAENSFNLFTVRKNSDAGTDEERQKLEVVGEYHLGLFVNRILHGSLGMRLPDSDAAHIPTLIYGTVEGVIGVMASLPQDQFAILQRLQAALNKVVKGVGGFSHEQWRSFCNDRKQNDNLVATNFVDGDLIESFLDLSKPKMDEVAVHMETSVEDLCKRVEELTRLH